MRVLIANKFWYYRAWQERVALDEYEWLSAAGHEVACFAPRHPATIETPWLEYFPEYIELSREVTLSPRDKARAAARLIHNVPAQRAFARLVEDFRPDVVHIHGIHRQLSPSILHVAIRRRIPVVQTLHDYHHICPADSLVMWDGRICDPRRCRVLDYSNCVRNTCVRGSLAASALSALETSVQRARAVYEKTIARFISPSVFMAEQMRRGGWSLPVDVVPNAVHLGTPASHGDYVVYAGRLDKTKGVDVLVRAAHAAGVRLVIAGDGPLMPVLQSMAHSGLEMRGHLGPTQVHDLVVHAAAATLPAVWYENAPMSVLEAMAVGTPVIASAIGGIAEQITDGVDGLLVSPGDTHALECAIRRLMADRAFGQRLGVAARETVAQRFSPEAHLEGILSAYRAAQASA